MDDYTTEIRLQEQKNSGKKKNRKGDKFGSLQYFNSLARIGDTTPEKLQRIYSCGTRIEFERNPENMEERVFVGTWYCGHRLCQICAKLRASKLGEQMKNIMEYIEKDGQKKGQKVRYIAMELSVKNVTGEELCGAIDRLMKGFNALTKRKAFKNAVLGWMRALEITANFLAWTFHPHFHVMVAVDEKYFGEGNDGTYENYIGHETLVEMWKSCMDLDYRPNVYVQKVRQDKEKGEDGTVSYKKSVLEMSKYPVKPVDYIVTMSNKKHVEARHGIKIENREHAEELMDWAVKWLCKAMHGRRMIGFGGIMFKARRALNLPDPEEVENTEEKKEETGKGLKEVYYFKGGKINDYVLSREETHPAVYEYLLIECALKNRGP
jgi:plasmid rolling circle replication initiator protein Rep